MEVAKTFGVVDFPGKTEILDEFRYVEILNLATFGKNTKKGTSLCDMPCCTVNFFGSARSVTHLLAESFRQIGWQLVDLSINLSPSPLEHKLLLAVLGF